MGMLAAVGREGHVASYEIREDLAEAARRNVATYFGEAAQWSLRVRDASSGFEERDVDAVVADVPDPEILIDAASKALRAGGVFAVYVPTVLQIKPIRDALAGRADFACAETLEVWERGWHVAGRSIRPEQRMIGHTGSSHSCEGRPHIHRYRSADARGACRGKTCLLLYEGKKHNTSPIGTQTTIEGILYFL